MSLEARHTLDLNFMKQKSEQKQAGRKTSRFDMYSQDESILDRSDKKRSESALKFHQQEQRFLCLYNEYIEGKMQAGDDPAAPDSVREFKAAPEKEEKKRI